MIKLKTCLRPHTNPTRNLKPLQRNPQLPLKELFKGVVAFFPLWLRTSEKPRFISNKEKAKLKQSEKQSLQEAEATPPNAELCKFVFKDDKDSSSKHKKNQDDHERNSITVY